MVKVNKMNDNLLLKIWNNKKISYDTKRGAEIYRRSMTMLLQCVVSELYPGLKIQIGQSLMNGYYFEMPQDMEFPKGFVKNISRRMNSIIEKDENIKRTVVSKQKAMELYRKKGREDKAKSISYLKKKKIELVFLRWVPIV